MLSRNYIELLSPARDELCARVAIDHGADAIYIGAEAFSARASAGNSIETIENVVNYAHIFSVRVYVAINTLLYDKEIEKALDLIAKLKNIGVDAIILQDFGLLEKDFPPIAIHASTQMSNHTAQKVKFLQNVGFEQVVLDRELTKEEILSIARQTTVRLEAFVHGALCVCYSGRCFMSKSINGRSANRGECAQPCRLPYTLRSGDGKVMLKDKHLLSLRDLNQTNNLEAMIDAGISSFKIEGRLKNADYVANVTLHYRLLIDQILERRPDLQRASSGRVLPTFASEPAKSFNRGFTTYFFNGRNPDIWQIETPKSLGEYLGRVNNIQKNCFTISTNTKINNGDGLFFINEDGSTDGLKVNKTENGKIYPLRLNSLRPNARIYRNSNAEFTKEIRNDQTKRVINIDLFISKVGDNFTLQITDGDNVKSETNIEIIAERAKNPDASRENLIRQLSKLGGTNFEARNINIDDEATKYFIPASQINELRRQAIENHIVARQKHNFPSDVPFLHNDFPFPPIEIEQQENFTNSRAVLFYARHGATFQHQLRELEEDFTGKTVMTTRHCILSSLGKCLKKHPESKQLLPLTIESGRSKYSLSFDCKKCEMNINKI